MVHLVSLEGFCTNFITNDLKSPNASLFILLQDSSMTVTIYPHWKQGKEYNLITYFAKVQLRLYSLHQGHADRYFPQPSFLKM